MKREKIRTTWHLPKMSVGYACNQYDCDGKTATTIILERPIDYDGEMVRRFVYGAPMNYLNNYTHLR